MTTEETFAEIKSILFERELEMAQIEQDLWSIEVSRIKISTLNDECDEIMSELDEICQ